MLQAVEERLRMIRKLNVGFASINKAEVLEELKSKKVLVRASDYKLIFTY